MPNKLTSIFDQTLTLQNLTELILCKPRKYVLSTSKHQTGQHCIVELLSNNINHSKFQRRNFTAIFLSLILLSVAYSVYSGSKANRGMGHGIKRAYGDLSWFCH